MPRGNVDFMVNRLGDDPVDHFRQERAEPRGRGNQMQPKGSAGIEGF